MPCTPEQLAANRANSAKSTGPKTTEGKERSRANGLKHGKAGAGIVLPAEEAAEVDRRTQAFARDLGAKTDFDLAMVQQIAIGSVRVERSYQQETAALATRVRHAEADFDENRAAELDDLVSMLEADPVGTVRRLKARPDGVDWLIAQWLGLKEDLLDPMPTSWSPKDSERFETLLGLRIGVVPPGKLTALFRMTEDWFDVRKPEDFSGIERAIQARKELAGRVDAEIERLEIERAGLDHEGWELDRAEAGARALFDPSPEARLARRYEAAAQRGMFRALRELQKARDLVVTGETSEPVKTSVELASSGKKAEARPTVAPTDPLPPLDWSLFQQPSARPEQFRELDEFLDELEARLDLEIQATPPGFRGS